MEYPKFLTAKEISELVCGDRLLKHHFPAIEARINELVAYEKESVRIELVEAKACIKKFLEIYVVKVNDDGESEVSMSEIMANIDKIKIM